MPSMSTMFSDLKYRLRAIFRRKSMEDELAAELQFHRERQAAKLVATGVPQTRPCGAPGSRWEGSSRSRKNAARLGVLRRSNRQPRTFTPACVNSAGDPASRSWS